MASDPIVSAVAGVCLILVTGCTAQRPPERDPCYLMAEKEAVSRAIHECDVPTDECEAWPAIEKELQEKQEACP